MLALKPYIVIPNIIEKPTWGGTYISKFKRLNKTFKIGQSFELFKNTNLSLKTTTENNPSLEKSQDTSPEKVTKLYKEKAINISQFINPDKLPLIKFTQAKGNSYQIHVKKKSGKWLPKPESWYYFEPGLLTLGVKPGINWQDFKKACKTNPEKFVNHIQVKKNQVIDVSAGGIHHSWSENNKTHPHGNILYEVQKNEYDPVSTLRCFDYGSNRKLNINDYFKYIDRSNKGNNPKTHMKKARTLKKTSTHTIKQIFNTSEYKMQQLHFANKLNNKYTQVNKDKFHHLFVKKGNLKLIWNNQTWTVTRGFSIFIPKGIKQYKLKTYKERWATVLKTYI